MMLRVIAYVRCRSTMQSWHYYEWKHAAQWRLQKLSNQKIWLQVDFEINFCSVWMLTAHPERCVLTTSKCMNVFVAGGKQYCTEAYKRSSTQWKSGLCSPQRSCDPQPNALCQAFECKLFIPLQPS